MRVVAGALAALVTSYLLVGMILSLRQLSRRKRTPRTPADAAPTSDPAAAGPPSSEEEPDDQDAQRAGTIPR